MAHAVFIRQRLHEVVPTLGRKAKTKISSNFPRKTSVLEVFDNPTSIFVLTQEAFIKFCGALHGFIKRFLMVDLRGVVDLFSWEVNARGLGQRFDGLTELHSLVIHDEAERISACTAAEAVVELFLRVYGKRGGFFLMERATGRVILPGFFKLHAPIHDINDVGSIENLIYECLWESGHLWQPKPLLKPSV